MLYARGVSYQASEKKIQSQQHIMEQTGRFSWIKMACMLSGVLMRLRDKHYWYNVYIITDFREYYAAWALDSLGCQLTNVNSGAVVISAAAPRYSTSLCTAL